MRSQRFLFLVCVVASLVPTAIGQTPKVSIVLGSLLAEEGGLEKPTSPLVSPFGLDFDSSGTMVIVELEGGRVHKLSPQDRLTRIAGDGSKSYLGDGGPASEATFNGMHNLAIGVNDDIYISDSWNHCVRKIDATSGIITTVAGTGKAGFGGDGGPADKALFDYIMCITLDAPRNQLLVADLKNRRIRAIDLMTRLVRTVAGNGKQGIPQDGGVATDNPLVDPRAVAADSKGNIYVLERGGHALRVVRPDGRIWTVAGNGVKGYKDGPALEAQLNSPKHLCVDHRDNVIIADDQNRAIRMYDPKAGTVTTVLGRGIGEPTVQLKRPHGVCYEQGDLYVVDTGNHRILRIKLAE